MRVERFALLVAIISASLALTSTTSRAQDADVNAQAAKESAESAAVKTDSGSAPSEGVDAATKALQEGEKQTVTGKEAAAQTVESKEKVVVDTSAVDPKKVAAESASVGNLSTDSANAKNAKTTAKDNAVKPASDSELPPSQQPKEEDAVRLVLTPSEYQFRHNLMSDLALQTQPKTGYPEELGQNAWAEQWFRLGFNIETNLNIKLVTQFQMRMPLFVGDEAIGVSASAQPRNDADEIELDVRWAYLEYISGLGMIRLGLQPSDWGLGLLANSGSTPPPFGDYNWGNRNLRLSWISSPFGQKTPFYLAIAGDFVIEDPLADVSEGDRAFQGVLAGFYREGKNMLGGYAVYRTQKRDVDIGTATSGNTEDELDALILDVAGKWHFPDVAGGEVMIGAEALTILGTTTITRSTTYPEHDVQQFMAAAQIGHISDDLELMFEFGYTSGDSNPQDQYQRRTRMHPDHQVGLILFPEALAWTSARAATLAQNADLSGRPSPGSDLLPTEGSVAGAMYLFNYATYNATKWLDLKLGWVWAMATSDVVDPYRQRAESRAVGFRGGDPGSRDLGFEVDAAILTHFPLWTKGPEVQMGIEGGLFLPGGAFDNAAGDRMDTMGMARFRFGLAYR